jgi:serine/threonine protein phosphatase 1
MKTRESADTSESGTSIRVIADRPRRLFVVGDIHGNYTELSILLDHLAAKHNVTSEDLFVFIGDYIDRGPASRQVIDRMLEIQRVWPKTVFLKGNHEEMLLSFLGLGGGNGQFYLPNGGAAFFASYGVEPVGPLSDLIAKLPVAHLEFIRRLELGVSLAEFIFVHAGLNPSRALEKQSSGDLLWIRKEFINAPHEFGKTVVFGHTAFNDIYLDLPYKIGIDTGVAYGNRLSIVELVHGDLYQVGVGEIEVRERSLRELLASRS